VIANYGYEDGSGFYYITIDGDTCATCSAHACVNACPQEVYAVEMDDYDDLVALVAEKARKRLKELCASCKALNGDQGTQQRNLPCTRACSAGAISHSW
jgi:ferredoxin